GVDRLNAGLHRLMHRLTRDDAGRLNVNATEFGGFDRALAVDRLTQRVDDAAQKALADRHLHDFTKATYFVPFADFAVFAEDNDADIVFFEVEGHALNARLGEGDHFTGLNGVEAIDAGDTIAYAEHLAYVRDIGFF